MNAKEEILKILTHQKLSWIHEKNIPTILAEEILECEKRISYYNELITAVESAIFNVPSEDEMTEVANAYGFISKGSPTASMNGFLKGCNYILNYKKQTDDRTTD